jgi:glycosyltransferase involved in cell wall biosynthesis
VRVLVVTQYYPPEVGAPSTRLATFAQHLAEAGHQVTVVAEVPNHPQGIVQPGFRGRPWVRRRERGVDVVHVWVAASTEKSFWRRMAFYLSFAGMASLVGAALALRRRPDVVLSSSPPLFVLGAGWVSSVAGRAPLVLDIRDLWPAVGVALGEVAGGSSKERAARWLERFLYRRAAEITTVTTPFAAHIGASGVPPERIHLVPNGTLPDVFTPEATDPTLRDRLGVAPDAFVIGYSGNHGIAQGLGALVAAADRLRDDPRFHVLFVGDGPERDALAAEVERRGLGSVTFVGEVPLDEVAPYLNACDLLVVPLRKLDLLEDFIPSKLFDYMACERPVALMLGGQAREVLEAAGAGWPLAAEDDEALADLARRLVDDRGELVARGRSGRAYVLEHYDRYREAEHLESVLRAASR